MEDVDELANTKWFRAVVIAALLSGTGSGVVNFTKDASDRFKGADFAREIRSRDAQIDALKLKLGAVESILNAHLIHGAIYTEKIDHLYREHDELKAEVHAHQRGGMHRSKE